MANVPATNESTLTWHEVMHALFALCQSVQTWSDMDAPLTEPSPSVMSQLPGIWEAWMMSFTPSSATTTPPWRGVHADDVMPLASSHVQTYMSHVQSCLTDKPAQLGPLFEQALHDPSLQAVLMMETRRILQQWSESHSADMSRVAVICHAIEEHSPELMDILSLYMKPRVVCEALEIVLSHMHDSLWQNASDLETVTQVIILLEGVSLLSTPCMSYVGEARVFYSMPTPLLDVPSLPNPMHDLLVRWCQAMTSAHGISDTLLSASPPWTLYRLAPTLVSHLLDGYRHGYFDKQALASALSYFTQAPLRYALPNALHWLITYTQQTMARAQYAPKMSSDVSLCLELLHMLTRAEGCTTLIRSMISAPLRAMLQHERIAAIASQTGLQVPTWSESLPTNWNSYKPTKYSLAMMLRTACDLPPSSTLPQTIETLCVAPKRPRELASQLFSAALCTASDDATKSKLLAATFALVRFDPLCALPLSVVRMALLHWDMSLATPEQMRHVGRILVLSAALAKHLPGGPDGVQGLIDDLAAFSIEPLVHVLRLEVV